MKEEVWKDIKGYEGFYQITNTGKVKSLARNIDNGTKTGRVVYDRLLKIEIDKNGYAIVTLNLNKKANKYKVHRLVALHFINIVPFKDYVNHKNGVKTDNNVENLEWVSIQENNHHSKINNLVLRGQKHPGCRTPPDKILLIKRYQSIYKTINVKFVSKKLNLSRNVVYQISKGITHN